MKLKEVLDKTTAFFRDKGFHSPRLDAEMILGHGLGLERIQLYLKFDQPMGEAELSRCRDLVRRRTQGEPVAYILGYKDFFGHRFQVSKDTLIPRPETEEMVEHVLNWLGSNKSEPLSLVDLGAGSGCIGLSLLKELPNAKLKAVDISPGAIEMAKANAESLETLPRVDFLVGDAARLADQVGHVDVLVANPPYIAEDDPEVESDVKTHEPSTALFAADSGLALLKSWSQIYGPLIKTPGLMIMEMGYKQGEAMREHFLSLELFKEVRVIKDLSGHDRFILGEK